MRITPIAALLAALTFAAPAAATTVSFGSFSAGAQSAATAGLTNLVSEDFELLGAQNGEGEVAPGTALPTAVGNFTTLGGTGTGGTVTQLSGNTGTNVALRDGNVFGRTNTTPSGAFFLDSNDTFGMVWDVATGSMFDTIVFSLMDASEFSYLRIMVDGTVTEQRTGGRLGNGNTSLVQIGLSEATSSLRIELGNFRSAGGPNATNDGFSIDSISVGLTPIPVPASLPLLVAGAGAFAFMRRKQRKAD